MMSRWHTYVTGLRWGTRTFLTQALVVASGLVTAAVVATAVGPSLFHQHLEELGHTDGSAEMMHVEQAFLDAGVRALGIGFLVALALAVGLAWLETRRLRAPLEALTAATARLETGDYAARVPTLSTSPEFGALSGAFNDMANRLGSTEAGRRRLLSDVAHELRTPLSTLTAELEALIDDVVPWDHASQELLLLQVARLRRIAHDLDDVSRAEEGRFRLDTHVQDVCDLVDAAVATAATSYRKKGVELSSQTAPAAGLSVDVDAQRIAQILGNLLDNAMRHTPSGGRVSVTARQAQDVVVIEVIDTGDGLTPDQLGQVFERFYRADASRARDAGGSGIGLTIARSLALAHGGTLTATSAGPGLGSTFTLHLPTATSPERFLIDS